MLIKNKNLHLRLLQDVGIYGCATLAPPLICSPALPPSHVKLVYYTLLRVTQTYLLGADTDSQEEEAELLVQDA